MFWANAGRLRDLRRQSAWMFLEEETAWKGSEEERVQRQLVGAAGSVGHSREERPWGLGERSEPSLSMKPLGHLTYQ